VTALFDREKTMPAYTTGKALQVLDLMIEFFADDDHWTQGHYRDPHGRHCVVGAVFQCEAWAPTRIGDFPSRSGIAPAADRTDRFQRSPLPQRGRIALGNS